MQTSFDPIELKVIAEQVAETLKPMLTAHATKGKTDDPAIFTPEELAEYMKVDLSWVYKQSQYGTLPYFKIGKYLRFKKADIDRAISKATIQASSELKLKR